MDKNQSYQNRLRVRTKEFIYKNPAAVKEIPLGDVKKLIEDLFSEPGGN